MLLALLLTGSASAQLARRVHREGPRVPAPTLSATTLRTRLGVEVAETLLKDTSSEERQRGFERLGSIGTAQSLDLLLKVFETGGAARSAEDRLIAVRALSEHAKVPAVRDFLVRVMVGVGSNPGHSEAIDGSIERAAALARFATDLGGGLLVTGGGGSFGVGGYFKSVLEEDLPVSMEVKNEHRKLSLAMAVALDRSGSMAAPTGDGRTKMDLANLGACAAIGTLGPFDEVGVIAVDSAPHVVTPLTPASDKVFMQRRHATNSIF